MIAIIDYDMGNLRRIHNVPMMAKTFHALYILLSCVFARTGGVNAMHVIGGASCIHIFQNFNKDFEPKS